MSKFSSKEELQDEIGKERRKLTALLEEIPDDQKTVEVVDGMSVKDFLAHRTEWGRMVIRWVGEARAGEESHVPHEKYKWNQLKELNAEIYDHHEDEPLEDVQRDFEAVCDQLDELVDTLSHEELFEKGHYAFTRSSDVASYINSATAAHYRSAYKHINKWWKTAKR